MKRFLLTLLFSVNLLCILNTRVIAQPVTIAGRKTKLINVFNDTVAAAVTKVIKPNASHSGWIRLDDYQFFSAWFTLTASPHFNGVSWGASDNIVVKYELYSGSTVPTSSSIGFLEQGDSDLKTLVTFAVGDTTDSRAINTLPVGTAKWYKSFHGTGDPKLTFSTYARFYTTVSGGFTGSGVTLNFDLKRQP